MKQKQKKQREVLWIKHGEKDYLEEEFCTVFEPICILLDRGKGDTR